jgi:hypothetical protein
LPPRGRQGENRRRRAGNDYSRIHITSRAPEHDDACASCMKHRRTFAALLLAAALAVSVYGCLLYASASLPFPDPTPELLRAQLEQLRSARNLAVAGALVAAGALVWLGWSRRVR